LFLINKHSKQWYQCQCGTSSLFNF